MRLKILAADGKGIAVEAEEITDEPVRCELVRKRLP